MTGPMDEVKAMEVALNALLPLTPEQRKRSIDWLSARIYDDIERGLAAARAVDDFVWKAAQAEA